MEVVSFTPRPLYPQGKSPRYPLDRRLGGPQSPSGRSGEEKNFQTSPGFEPQSSDCPARSQPLYRLNYPGPSQMLFGWANQGGWRGWHVAQSAYRIWVENLKGRDHLGDQDVYGMIMTVTTIIMVFKGKGCRLDSSSSRDSAGVQAGWSVVRVPAAAGNFSLHHRVQTGSGAHPTSYPMDTRGSFPRGIVVGAWSWPLTSI
jgi:hypothetical protein